jgi:membrane fusion protein
VVVTAVLVGFLATGTYARKETVTGWLAPSAGLAEVRALNGGVVAAVGVAPGAWVREEARAPDRESSGQRADKGGPEPP